MTTILVVSIFPTYRIDILISEQCIYIAVIVILAIFLRSIKRKYVFGFGIFKSLTNCRWKAAVTYHNWLLQRDEQCHNTIRSLCPSTPKRNR